jgi:hypothetical protein
MTLQRTIQSYASPKRNARVLANPTTDITQVEWNLLVNDAAQLTATPVKLRVQFPTAVSNGAVTPSWFAAQWGSGSASAPAIARTGTGIYTVATPSTWVTPGTYTYSLDPDGIAITSEQVIWVDSSGDIDGPITSAPAGWVRTARSGYTVTVHVYNSSWTLSDLGGAIPIRIEAC